MAAQKTHSELSTAPMWCPSRERVEKTNLTAFFRFVRERGHSNSSGYARLHRWSIEKPDEFWQSVWDFCGIVASRPAERVVGDFDRFPGTRWFPGARLNFAENLLRYRDDRRALVFWNEAGFQRSLTFAELYAAVARTAAVLKERGVKSGDRIAGIAAQHARGGHRHARGGEPGGDLVIVLARFRRAGRGRPLQPDRTEDSRRGRRLRVRRPALRFARAAANGPAAATVGPACHRHSLLERAAGPGGNRSSAALARRDRSAAADGPRVRAVAVRSSALHLVFIGNDGPAQVHRAHGRRRADPTPKRTRAALRPASRGRVDLLHHMRLDDVELAGERPGSRQLRWCSSTDLRCRPRRTFSSICATAKASPSSARVRGI